MKKSLGVDFYEARSDRLMETLTTLYQNGTITAEEADWWVKRVPLLMSIHLATAKHGSKY